MEQRTEEWQKARKGLVTASNVGAILGLDPWRTEDDVMRMMVREHFGAAREFTGNPATAWGEANEPGAITDFVMETGTPVRRTGFVKRDDIQWLGASPDGMIGNDGLIEIKCPYKFRDTPAPVPFVPAQEQRHYYAQMQVQMFCTVANWCFFWQWAPNGTKLEKVDRDEVFLEWAIPELYAFYQRYLEIVGDPDRSSPYLEEKRGTIDNVRARQLVEEYEVYAEAEDRAKERKKEILAAIVLAAGEKNCTFGGKSLTLVNKDGAVSYATVVKKFLPQLDLNPFRGKPSSYWMLK